MPVRFSARSAPRCVAITAVALVCMLAGGRHGLEAKAPGVSHCYKSICHRVRTLEETRLLLGSTLVMATSHYDFPWNDRFNIGVYTSNGERFDAGDRDRVSSSDLPDGTELLLRNPENGRVSHVRVNDFGPFHGDRRLDVTRRVADDLGFAKRGVTEIEVTIIAIPREEDLAYRRNRQRTQAMGPLGVYGEADMPALINHKLAARSPADAGRIFVAEPLHLRARPEVAPDERRAIAAETPFPHLAGKQIGSAPGWIEVRYEASLSPTAGELTDDPAPASALDAPYPSAVGGAERNTAGARTPQPVPVVIAAAERSETLEAEAATEGGLYRGLAYPAATTAPAFGAVSAGSFPPAAFVPVPKSTSILLLIVAILLTMAFLVAHRNLGATASLTPRRTSPRNEPATAVLARDATPLLQPAAHAPTQAQQPVPAVATSGPAASSHFEPTPATALEPATSLIDASLSLVGALRTTGRVAIAGYVEGRVEAGGIEVFYGGRTRGALIADEVFINGDVEGTITARLVRIGPNARVVAEITCYQISIEGNAYVEADVRRPRLPL